MQARNSQSRKHLGFQQLEARQMLAGDVYTSAASKFQQVAEHLSGAADYVSGLLTGSDGGQDQQSHPHLDAADQSIVSAEQLQNLSAEEIQKLINIEANGGLTGASPEVIQAAKSRYAEAIENAGFFDKIARFVGLPNDIDAAEEEGQKDIVIDGLKLPAAARDAGLNADDLVDLSAELQLAGDDGDTARDPSVYELIKELGPEAGKREVVKRRIAESFAVPEDIAKQIDMEELDTGLENAQKFDNYDAIQNPGYWEAVKQLIDGAITPEQFQADWDVADDDAKDEVVEVVDADDDTGEPADDIRADDAVRESSPDNQDDASGGDDVVPPFLQESGDDQDGQRGPYNQDAVEATDETGSWQYIGTDIYDEGDGTYTIVDTYALDGDLNHQAFVNTLVDGEGNKLDESVTTYDNGDDSNSSNSGDDKNDQSSDGGGDDKDDDKDDADKDDEDDNGDDDDDDGDDTETSDEAAKDDEKKDDDKKGDDDAGKEGTPTPDSVDVNEQNREDFLNSPTGSEQRKQDERAIEMAMGGGLVAPGRLQNWASAVDFLFSEIGQQTLKETERQVEARQGGGVTDPPEFQDSSSSTAGKLDEVKSSGGGQTDPPETANPKQPRQPINPKSPVGPPPMVKNLAAKLSSAKLQFRVNVSTLKR